MIVGDGVREGGNGSSTGNRSLGGNPLGEGLNGIGNCGSDNAGPYCRVGRNGLLLRQASNKEDTGQQHHRQDYTQRTGRTGY